MALLPHRALPTPHQHVPWLARAGGYFASHPHLRHGSLALLAAVLCWGVSVPLSKSLLESVDPLPLIRIQLAGSLAMLLLIALLTRTHIALPPWRTLLPLTLIGALEPGVAYYLEFVGMQHTSALHTSLILALEPCGIVLLNILFFHFRRDLALMLGTAIASLGVLGVILGSGEGAGGGSVYGDLIVFLGTMAASLYVSLSTQLNRSGSILWMLIVQQASSLLFVVVLRSVAGDDSADVSDAKTLLACTGVGCLQFALAFLLYFYGVRRAPAYWGVAVLNFMPLVSAVCAMALLGESPGPLYVAGGLVTLTAVFWIRRREHVLEELNPPDPQVAPERSATLVQPAHTNTGRTRTRSKGKR